MLFGPKAEYGPPLEPLYGVSSIIAFIVALLIGSIAYVVLKRRTRGTEDSVFLARWFAVGFAVRVIFCVFNAYIFINTHLISYDTATYEFLGRWWIDFWSGGIVTPPPIGGPYQNYGFWVAIQYLLTGSSPLVPYFTNALIGAWLPVVTYQILTEQVGDRRAARFAFLLMMFEPDLVAWSGIIGHDIALTLLGTLFIRDLIMLLRQFQTGVFVRLLLWVALIFSLRPYIVAVIGATALVSFGMVKLRTVNQRIAFGMVALLGVAALVVTGRAGLIVGSLVQEAVKNIAIGRYDLIAGGGDGMYMVDINFSTPLDIIEFIPKGWAYLVFGPFPWFFHSALYWLLLIPALGFWYFGLIYGVVGLFNLRKLTYLTVPLVTFFLFGTLLYGMITSSFIMAVRYRSQFGCSTAVLSAVGFCSRRKRRSVEPLRQTTYSLVRTQAALEESLD